MYYKGPVFMADFDIIPIPNLTNEAFIDKILKVTLLRNCTILNLDFCLICFPFVVFQGMLSNVLLILVTP